MARIRPPAVAGRFYPGEPEVLAQEIAGLLGEASAGRAHGGERPSPKALIVPHAGYPYSGPVAARAYAAVADLKGLVTRVVVLGPAHFVAYHGLALPRADFFETPLGELAVDAQALDALIESPDVRFSDQAHEREHSLEVQLPFVQQALGGVGIVPILVGEASAETVAAALERLWDGEETLIIVSSDLSHYHPYGVAQRLDAATAEAIEALDESRLSSEQACGYRALAGLLLVLRRREFALERLDLRNSGDTAGPRDGVVGYGAWAAIVSTPRRKGTDGGLG
jgi:AmmeMemoRadiSam system protein B